MKTILFGLAACSALAAAAPAAAQYRSAPDYRTGDAYESDYDDDYRSGAGFADRIARLRARVDSGYQARRISRDEAAGLRTQLYRLGELERRYARNGLSEWERQDLQQRIRSVRQDLRSAEGADYDDRGGRDGRWDDDDRWDDDRNGRWDDNDRWDDDDDRYGGGLRVGQRAGGTLYGLPLQYRTRYRDGAGVYYRYNDGMIYRIDARSHIVLQVIPTGR